MRAKNMEREEQQGKSEHELKHLEEMMDKKQLVKAEYGRVHVIDERTQ